MKNEPILTIFLSAATQEFHSGEEDWGAFQSYRECLQNDLSTIRQFHVVSQENLQIHPGSDLLETLERSVADADYVIHLVGNVAGTTAKPAELRRLRERCPDFLDREPEMKSDFVFEEISYTQWEFYFTVQNNGKPFVYRSDSATPVRSGCNPSDADKQKQAQHLARVKQRCAVQTFIDQNDLIRQVFLSLITQRILILTPVQSTPSIVARVRETFSKLLEQMRSLVSKPDPIKVRVPTASKVNAIAAAIAEVSEANEISPPDLIDVYNERQAELVNSAGERDYQSNYELALASYSFGEFQKALLSGEKTVSIAERVYAEKPSDESAKENLLNACLLLADVYGSVRDRESRLEILIKGGELIDKEAEPVFWADYHEEIADHHLEHADWDRAEYFVNEIVDIHEEHSGEESMELANALLLWCRLLYLAKADFSGTASVSKRAIEIFKPHGESKGLATSMSHHAMALSELGQFEKAEQLMRHSLIIHENIYGEDDPEFAIGLHNLAWLLHSTKRTLEAKSLMKRALEISERAFGNEHPQVAASLGNLALLLQDTNNPNEAESMLLRALEIDEKTLGRTHPDVAIRLNNLAELLRDTNRLSEVEPLIRRALAIDEQAFGNDSPRVAIHLNNLAQLLGMTNRHAEAESLMWRQLETFAGYTKNTGLPHEHLRASIGNYLNLVIQMGVQPEIAFEKIMSLEIPQNILAQILPGPMAQ